MAITIKQSSNCSWMSQASYLDFAGLAQNDQQALRNKLQNSTINPDNIFTATQAAAFTDPANGFGFTSYRPNDDSGFSATVFKSNSAPNDYTIAVRGTEPTFGNLLSDLVNADALGVGLQGAAYDQAISAYRYYKQLTTTNGQQVSYTAAELAKLSSLYDATLLRLPNPILDAVVRALRVNLFRTSLTDAANADNLGLGAIDPATAQIHFTGHSLGGHVATLLAAMVQQFGQGNVADVLTYNAPGQGGIFGVDILVDATPIAGKITDLIGEGGMTFTAGVGNYLGARDRIFIELSSTNPVDNHSIVKLSDSLAVYDILAKIDPALNTADPAEGVDKVTRFLKAASNQAPETLERTVNALVDFFGLNFVPLTGALIDNREELYTRVASLQTKVDAVVSTASLTIDDLTGMAATDLANIAQGSVALAYRYALKELNPFAIVGNNGLYAEHNANGELNLYDPDAGTGTLTTRWLEDRAKFVTTKIGINTNDQLVGVNSASSDNYWYQDKALGENAYVLSSNLSSARRNLRTDASAEALLKKTEAKRVFFGTDAADAGLTGGANADALYGNGGDDRLSGLGGADYLQGDAGWDKLYGGDDNDELAGGKGDDLLLGGAGIDTYTWNTGDGFDTIVDSDGAGKILFAGADLTGAYEQKGDDPKTFGNAEFTLTWNGKLAASGSPEGTGWLTIAKDSDASGKVRILGFDSATTFLGINLNGVPSTQVYTDLSGTSGNDTLAADASFQKVYGLDGNDRITVSTAGAVAYGGTGIDYISNGAADQKLYGEAGNDILVASDGNDELYGGIDNDALQGGADDDYLEGNEGDDVLDGGAGGDVLIGGDGSDVLLGGGSIVPYFLSAWDPNNVPDFGVLVVDGVAGLNNMAGYLNIEGDAADVLDGGAGNDTLLAGDGDDLLKGGSEDDLLDGQAGNDTLEGGDGADLLYGDGTQGDISVGGLDPYTLAQFHGDDYLDGGAGDDTLSGDGGSDALYGGEGDDILLGDASGLAEEYHGADYLDGGAGNDQLWGYGKDDTLIGGAGDDVLEGDSNTVAYDKHGSDYLDGGDGIDVLKGDGGSDTLFGGEGDDQLFGDADDTPVVFQGDDYLDGEAGDDYLRGYGGNDTLFGGGGADQLLGEAGNDYLDGEAGNDLLSGGEGNDELFGGDGADDLQGDAGDDYLAGEDGNDLLSGGSGNDQLSGGAGMDQLAGDEGDDVLDGGADDDTLFGDAGNDSLSGGDGNDALSGGSGNDQLSGGAGDDQLAGDDGDDVVDGGAGDDLLFGDAGKDTLFGGAGNDEIQGGDGNDIAAGGDGDDLIAGGTGDDILAGVAGSDELQGGDGNDTASGGDGDDVIFGETGNDFLAGGAGNDYLEGGDGNDTYFYNPGDGIDHIRDSNVGGQVNTLVFGAGIDASQITLGLGSLRLDLGNGDAIHLDNFNPDDAVNSASIQRFEFADGTVLGAQQFLARGFDLGGTEGNDTVRGTSADDRITGGTGNDTLMGGLGNDTYVYNRGDGADSVVDAWIWTLPSGETVGNTNTLSLGAGITPDAIGVRLDSATRHVTLDFGGGDSVDIGLADNIAIQTLQFADGSSQGIQEFLTATQFDIAGTAAADTLTGTPFNDRIDGKGGDDVLTGGAGSDLYLYNVGDGADTLYDNGRYFGFPGADGNTLKFGPGITPDTIQVRHDGNASLFDLGGGDSIVVGATSFSDEVLHGFDLTLNPFTTFAIQTVEFDDGATLGIQAFVTQRGLAKTGAAGADALAGDDLYHGWIPDRLEGGAGDDTLQGGAGSDLYVFNRGDGADTIGDSAQGMVWDAKWLEWLANGPNTLIFGAGIAPEDIVTRVDNAGNHLLLDLGNGDRIDIGRQYDLAVQTVRFADGTQWGIDSLIALRPVEVSGTADADYLSGSRFSNRIEGFAGDDTLLGGDDADVLEGGTGNDTLAGQWGSDTYRFNLGDGADTVSDTSALQGWDAAGQPLWLAQPNTLAFGPGITADMIAPLWDGNMLTLDLGAGDSIAVGHLTDIAIQTLAFDDGSSVSMQDFLAQKGTIQLAGAEGADLMATFGNGATLQGLGGDDQLYGSPRDDVLEGGRGDDLLVGSSGSDTYIYNLGDGADEIVNYGGYWPSDVNTLSFGAGIAPEMVAPVYDGALMLDLGGGDSVVIGAIDELAVQRLQFAGGETLTVDQLVALWGGFAQVGSAYDDVMYGTQFDDRLEGRAGADTIYADDGNDTLVGGPGNDMLAGEAGDDVYIFRRGDGADIVDDLPYHWGGLGGEFRIPEVNTLKLGPGITPTMITPIFDQNQIVTLDLGGGDSARIGWQTELAIQQLVFSDGTAFPVEGLWSGEPVASAIADQVTHQGDSFSFAGAANAFFDFDGDSLSYAATLADGRALPAWLDFDGASGTFSGVPGNSDVALIDLKVTASDSSGFSASSGFKLDVLNVNDPPAVVAALPDRFAVQGQAFSFSLSPGDGGTGGADGFLSDPADTGTAYSGALSYDSYQYGGPGNDTYQFGRGSGNSYVADWDSTPGNVDTVQFGPDVLPADISLSPDRWGDLVLSIDAGGDSLTLEAWFSYEDAKIERFEFADGTVWGVDDVISGMSITPTIGNDYVLGSAGNDWINALAGEDLVFGGAGDDALLGGAGNDGLYGDGGSDVLSGGSGADGLIADSGYSDAASDLLAGGGDDDVLDGSISNDLLIGGAGDDEVSGNDGNDVVLFNRGDGNDYYATDASENGLPVAQRTDTVSLGGGIAYADLAFGRDADDLILHVGNEESIAFSGWFNTDGQDNKAISRLQVVAEAMAGYDSLSADPLLNQRIEQFDFVGLANRFEADLAADPGITTWQLAPHLADFSLGGSDTEAIGGDLAYLYGKDGTLDRLTETEARAELTDARFGVAAQTLTKTNMAAGTSIFDDIDFIHGDYLTLSAAKADGSALPAWLSFDAATGTFSGTPANGDVGDLSLKATATDTAGASASQTFTVTVANVNDAPVVAAPIGDQFAAQDRAFSFIVPANSFTDIDVGDLLSYSATLANGDPLPAWLSFDAAARTFSGTPASGDPGGIDVNVMATDLAGASANQTFALAVTTLNDSPVALPDSASVSENAAIIATGNVLTNDFDINAGTVLTVADAGVRQGQFGTLALGSDGSYLYALDNAAAAVQSLAQGQVLTDRFGYTATDNDPLDPLTANAVLTVGITGTNDVPVAVADSASVREDVTFSAAGNALANDSDVDQGTVLAVAAPGTYAGTYGSLTLAADGSYSYALANGSAAVQGLAQDDLVKDVFDYEATDGIASTPAALTVSVTGMNDAPVAVADSASAQEDLILGASGNVLDNDSDADTGTVLSVANSGTYAGTYGTFVLAADGSYSYTLDNAAAAVQALAAGQSVTDAFAYAATDGIASAFATLTVNVTGANDAPVVANPIADQSAAAGGPFNFTVAADTFFDIDAGDALRYAATLADGTPLPSWLSFDAATRTFTGTPPGGAGMAGALQLRVDATDTAGASAFDVFALNISGGNGGGQTIIGTDRDDVLAGTPGNDIIDGRKGFDRMSGGKGDDVYYVDETCSSSGEHHGNEGVGNGEDPPPPGHEHNRNDGPGTSPGHPGSRHGGNEHDDDHGGSDHGTQCRVDEVIEKPNEGYDTVYSSADYTLTANLEELHLVGGDDLTGHGNALDNIIVGNSGDNALYGEAGDDLLVDDAGNDALYGGAGKDVLDGGAGDDTLIGGAGDDTYVHALAGGDDVVQESGGRDTIRFGEGIAASAVSVLRKRDDLVLKLSGRNDSVTVKNWFSGSASRVERVQFADGSAWNETQMRALAGQGSGRGSGEGRSSDSGHDEGRSSRQDHGGSGHGGDRHDGDRHDDNRDDDRSQIRDARDAIAARLEKSANYDFTALSTYLAQQRGGGYGALTAAQVAEQWRSVQNRVGQLAQDDEDTRRGAHGGEYYGSDDGLAHGATFWGYAGSTGQNRGYGGMAAFGGLDEGFRKLG